jgi:hypothetical protein
VDVGVFALYGAQSDIRVLDKWSEIAFERCTSLDVECVVVDPVVLA